MSEKEAANKTHFLQPMLL